MTMKADDLSSITETRCSGLKYETIGDGEDADALRETGPSVILHGREDEKLRLYEVFRCMLSTDLSQVVFVHGASGMGKSSLVDTLREPVCSSDGYFCSGKFFQDSNTQEPYSAISSAFSDLCDLVVQSQDFDEESRNRVQQVLTVDAQLLSRVINLKPFFPETSTELVHKNTSTFARFRVAFKNLLHALASKEHPIVLFLDDLQWMDDDSQRLIEMFILDEEIKNVMFAFCYRDEEASAVVNILQTPRNGGITDIQVSNLALQSVRSMIASKLESPDDGDMDTLSKLALKRTGGSPFFLCLFLEVLAREEFVVFDGSRSTFNVDQIRCSLMVANSMADLLSQKICRLSDEVRDVLIIASLIGYSFDVNVILEVLNIVELESHGGNCTKRVLPHAVPSSLEHAVNVGLIEALEEGRYQFTHDRLQSAFQELADESVRENLHMLIGKTYLAQETEGSVYYTAVHLNEAPGFLSCDERFIELARINLDAARHCQKLSAFDKAVSLLHAAIGLLDSIGVTWSCTEFDLSFELKESLARMTLLVGDFEACAKTLSEVMQYVDTYERKMSIMLINVECKMVNNQIEESVKAARRALSELGVSLPRKCTTRHVVFKSMKLKFVMARKTDEEILDLPPVECTTITVAIRLLMHVTFNNLLIGETATGVYAALHAMELTLHHGLSTHSPPALALFGITVLRMGDVGRAYSLGKLALKLLERSSSREADCSTIGFVNSMLLHWKEPLADLRAALLEASNAGFDNGDLTYSTYCMTHVTSMDSVDGTHLEMLEGTLNALYCRLEDFGREERLIWIRPQMQRVANLRSTSTEWYQLTQMSGDFMDFQMHLKEANSSTKKVVMGTCQLMKGQLANAFGLHTLARETFDEAESFGRSISLTFFFTLFCWGAAVANYECFRTDGKRKYLRKARRYKRLLEQRDAFGPNASTFLKHLKLKETVLGLKDSSSFSSPRQNKILSRLDSELEIISEDGNPCFAVAGALVDAGSIAERMGRYAEADHRFARAQDIYNNEWGAFAPASWLQEKRDGLQRHQQQAVIDIAPMVGEVVQFGEEE